MPSPAIGFCSSICLVCVGMCPGGSVEHANISSVERTILACMLSKLNKLSKLTLRPNGFEMPYALWRPLPDHTHAGGVQRASRSSQPFRRNTICSTCFEFAQHTCGSGRATADDERPSSYSERPRRRCRSCCHGCPHRAAGVMERDTPSAASGAHNSRTANCNAARLPAYYALSVSCILSTRQSPPSLSPPS